MMNLRRLAPLALFVPALAAGATLGPRWPQDQTVRYELGDAASRVEEIDARWAPRGRSGGPSPDADGDWSREATFRYAPGRAPRIVSHTPRLANGEYSVEIALRAAGATQVLRRQVTLAGGTTTIDLTRVIP